jgi:hypothetical protein
MCSLSKLNVDKDTVWTETAKKGKADEGDSEYKNLCNTTQTYCRI